MQHYIALIAIFVANSIVAATTTISNPIATTITNF